MAILFKVTIVLSSEVMKADIVSNPEDADTAPSEVPAMVHVCSSFLTSTDFLDAASMDPSSEKVLAVETLSGVATENRAALAESWSIMAAYDTSAVKSVAVADPAAVALAKFRDDKVFLPALEDFLVVIRV